MQKFKIQVSFKEGYEICEIEAKSFASACLIKEKDLAKRFVTPISFTRLEPNLTYRVYDTIAKAYVMEADGKTPYEADEKQHAMNFSESIFDNGNYPDHPSSVIQIHCYTDGKFSYNL